MTLAEVQELFHRAVTSPEDADRAALQACFVGTAVLPADQRLAIYAGMYRGRLLDALRATYPAVARLVGDELEGLAADYLRAHPSEHHDVGQVGRLLPEFLRAHPDPARPDLADLAALEWARQEAFFAPPIATVGQEALAALDARALPLAVLRFVPALRLLTLSHEVIGPWRALTDNAGPPPPVAAPSAVAVWRAGHAVFHASLPPEEASALRSAMASEPLGSVCAAFAACEEPVASAFRALSSWFTEGWVERVSGGGSCPSAGPTPG